MSRRVVIGGVDVTDDVRCSVDNAPPLSPEQLDQLRGLFRGLLPSASPRKARRPHVVATSPDIAAEAA
jgi:hypothetical protein